MTIEEKKDLLWSYRAAMAAVNRIRGELEKVRVDRERSKDPEMSKRLRELENQLVEAECRRVDRYGGIMSDIETMPNEIYKLILSYRYLNGYTWGRMSEVTGYSVAHLHKIHAKALKSFRNEG